MRLHDPAHPGETARDNLEAEGWTANECASRLGVSRITLWRLLNGHAGVSAAMMLALERIGWGHCRALGAHAGQLGPGPGAPAPGGSMISPSDRLRCVKREIICV